MGTLLMVFPSMDLTAQDKVVNKELLLEGIEVLAHDSLEGRGFGSEGGKKAQAYIAATFRKIGIDPAFESGYIQSFSHTVTKRKSGKDTTYQGGNVVALIPGESDRVIVITGHLDHLGIRNGKIYNGADDDASGTAALFAIADYFKDRIPKHTLVLAAVDAEEVGSPGCRYLIDNFPGGLDKVVLNINMDMISRNDDNEIYAAGLHHYPQLAPPVKSLKSSVKLLFGHDNPKDKKLQDWTNSSDHREFHQKGIPFIYFGVEDHKDYHKPTDTFDTINQEFYIRVVGLIIQAVEAYDQFLN